MSHSIDKFKSATPTGKRARTSPEMIRAQDKKKCNEEGKIEQSKEKEILFDKEELMKRLSMLMDTKMGALATKQDIQILHNNIIELKEENKTLKAEIETLKVNFDRVKKSIDNVEKKVRQNNLIFKGVKYNEGENLNNLITSFCDKVLDIKEPGINSVHPIGRKELPDRPLLCTLDSRTKVVNILKNTKKIKRNWFLYPKGFTLGSENEEI